MRVLTLIYIPLMSLFCLLAVAINITWRTLPITMPFSCSHVITALDINTDLVWILGGFCESDETDARLIYQWDMTSGDSFTQIGALLDRAYVHAQSWVTRHNIIYWVCSSIGSRDTHIHSFNMSSAMEIANDLDASFPYRECDRPCVTTDDDKYLIVAGGRASTRWSTSTRIYNFETNAWLPNPPNLNEARYSHSCNVYKGSVYAIGGLNSKTIEKLDLETLSNWITSSHQLIIERAYHRSVLINDFIVVTGGLNVNDDDYHYLKSVEIISMIDDSITRATDLNVGIRLHGIIRGPMNNVIIIGGWTSSSPKTNKIQVSNAFANETIAIDDLNTEATNDPNLSNQSSESTNAMTYLVVGVICFACFFVVCYLMWRKMRNTNLKNLKEKVGFISLS